VYTRQHTLGPISIDTGVSLILGRERGPRAGSPVCLPGLLFLSHLRTRKTRAGGDKSQNCCLNIRNELLRGRSNSSVSRGGGLVMSSLPPWKLNTTNIHPSAVETQMARNMFSMALIWDKRERKLTTGRRASFVHGLQHQDII
jgi:hypothetical protein